MRWMSAEHLPIDYVLITCRHEVEVVTTELNEVKESYVALSEESRWIEKQTRERCEEEAREKMKEAQTKWDEARSCELLKLRQTLSTELERTLEKEKETWRAEEEQKLKSKVETEIALAKIDWSKVSDSIIISKEYLLGIVPASYPLLIVNC